MTDEMNGPHDGIAADTPVACVQGELTALEPGLHALHSKLDVKAYAKSVKRPETTVGNEVRAARVAAGTDIGAGLSAHFSQLVEIHAAPQWLWPALVAALAAEKWTVADAVCHVAKAGQVGDPLRQADQDATISSPKAVTPGG
jgi:hypothetical protein